MFARTPESKIDLPRANGENRNPDRDCRIAIESPANRSDLGLEQDFMQDIKLDIPQDNGFKHDRTER